METVTIKLDLGNGPIWKECVDLSNGSLSTGIDVIDADETLQKLDASVQKRFAAYYEFDSRNEAVGFDREREMADKNLLIDQIEEIKRRLDEINDGSYVVIDEETDRLRAL